MSYARNEIAINLIRVRYITRVEGDAYKTRFHFDEESIVVEIPYAEALASFHATILALVQSGRPLL